ncbi:MAG: inositol monophosphatase [Actinomycetota bacterium]|nr:inositol monophosphatase [Actinomycetota bacterium]MDP9020753.1 inositol monophosphatase [Actinomycetota bacterium]
MPPVPTAELLDLAVRLARQAGDLLLDGRGRRPGDVSTKTSGTDMVSEVDRASERLIVNGLRDARPGDGILAEEGTDDTSTTGVTWVVDPLDGTTNYLYGFPAFAVSVAAQVEGVSQVGVVVDPSHGETFTAIRGGGAWCNGRRLRCTSQSELATALVATGFSYSPDRRAHQAGVLVRLLPSVRDIRRAGAASLDLCWVACGRVDAFYERGLQPWDLAAGTLVAEEAGASTGSLGDEPASGELTIAAPPGLFEPLRRLLDDAGAGQG